MNFQYVFGNPTRKKHKKHKKASVVANPKKKRKSKRNPARQIAKISLPSGKILKSTSHVFPEPEEFKSVGSYLKALGQHVRTAAADYKKASELGDKKAMKAAEATLKKATKTAQEYELMIADMGKKAKDADKFDREYAGKGYSVIREIQRGNKWYTDSAWADKLAAEKAKKEGKAAKAAKAVKGKAAKEKKVKETPVRVLNWLKTVPKLSKYTEALTRKQEMVGEVAQHEEEFLKSKKKSNPTRKGKGIMAKKRKSRKKHHAKKVAKIGKKGISKRAIKKIRRKKSKKYIMEVKTKAGRKQTRKFSLRRSNPKRRNPFSLALGGVAAPVTEWTGYNVAELGALGLGGAIYGATNGLLSRIPYVNKAHDMLLKVPVVGASLPTLVLGAVLHKFLGKKNAIVGQIAQGLIGASVVGMGVSASQLIPFLKVAPLKGLGDFGPDFGEVDFGRDADFGEIPQGMAAIPSGMEGVDYTMGEGQMGDVEFNYDLDGVDYTMEGIPAGLSGEGQMG